jgi:hypothetical protein
MDVRCRNPITFTAFQLDYVNFKSVLLDAMDMHEARQWDITYMYNDS